MISSLPINQHRHTYSCWFTTRRNLARIHPLSSLAAGRANTLCNPQRAKLQQLTARHSTAESSPDQVRSLLVSTAPGPKSP